MPLTRVYIAENEAQIPLRTRVPTDKLVFSKESLAAAWCKEYPDWVYYGDGADMVFNIQDLAEAGEIADDLAEAARIEAEDQDSDESADD